MRNLFSAIVSLPRSLLRIALYVFTFRFLTELIEWIRRVCELKGREGRLRDVRRGRPLRCAPRCAVVRPDVYKRADPLIYSQTYLMEQGLAVTWDNPDIQLFDGGVPVPSSQLQAGKTYEVVATVYNNSTDAPAVGLPVEFSFRSFGVGATLTSLGSTTIDLGPYESALIGTPIADEKMPLEILRTIHSFDPCMACGVHLLDVNGNEINQITLDAADHFSNPLVRARRNIKQDKECKSCS